MSEHAREHTRRYHACPRSVVAFSSTHEALTCERVCKELKLEGRLIPTPVAIHADCGLAWSMPVEVRAAFERDTQGCFIHAGIYDLVL